MRSFRHLLPLWSEPEIDALAAEAAAKGFAVAQRKARLRGLIGRTALIPE